MAALTRCVFSVDVEADWCGSATRGIDIALPRLVELLARHRARATFFVVGELAERVRPHLDPKGPHEVASHGLSHARLTRLPRAEVEREIAESKRRLEAAGYTITGFRAPFLAAPRELPEILARAGYAYDASLGSVLPGAWRARAPAAAASERPIRFSLSKLRDRLTPFSLTWLRICAPFGLALAPRGEAVFLAHLHELVDSAGGVPSLPWPLRALHARGAGARAWRILERLLADPRRAFVPFREILARPR